MRGVSHSEPNATVVVIFSGPLGRSFDSEISPSAIASLAKTSRAVRNSSSPCSVRIRPRAWRWNSGTLRLSSSALIWRLTADWLRFSPSPAWVKLPASATDRKTRSLSQSIPLPSRSTRLVSTRASFCRGAVPTALFGCPDGPRLLEREEALGLERAHAAHAGGGDRLAEHLVLDVARREHAGHVGRRRIRRRADVALGVHVELAAKQLGRRRVADRHENALDRKLVERAGLDVLQAHRGDVGRIVAADD